MVTIEAQQRPRILRWGRSVDIPHISSPRGIPVASIDLRKVRLPEYGVTASANALYAGGNFLRDGVQTARHLITTHPTIAEEIITTAVRFQGKENRVINEEALGKYHHEHRDTEMIEELAANGVDPAIVAQSRIVLENLSRRWGGESDSITVYFAADTTPAVVSLVGFYDALYPEQNILAKQVIHQDGEEIAVGESVATALRYITGQLMASDLGLLEYHYQNPDGIQNQYFKDSFTSLIFADTQKYVNFEAPVAEIGLQGLVYDSLEAGKRLFTKEQLSAIIGVDAVREHFAKPAVWELFSRQEIEMILGEIQSGMSAMTTFDAMQQIIQRQVLRRFWMRKEGYFASALDHDPTTGEIRQVDAIASNPAALLDSGIFDTLPDSREKVTFIGSIAARITGKEFLTDAGPRARSLKHKDALIVPNTGQVLDDYHGSFVVWPNEVYIIASGLRRQGFHQAAEQLEIRHTNAFNIAGTHTEFHLVDEAGRLQIHELAKKNQTIPYTLFHNPNHSEEAQTWGISSNLAIKQARTERFTNPSSAIWTQWQRDLDNALIESMRVRGAIQKVHKTKEEIEAARQLAGVYMNDAETGQKLDNHFRRVWGGTEWTLTTS